MSIASASVAEICEMILRGEAPAGLIVQGHLDFSDNTDLAALPDFLTVRRLTLNGCTSLQELPRGLRCYELCLRNTALKELPKDIQVEFRLDLSDCTQLEKLPEKLAVGSLILNGCTSLAHLPEGLDVSFLDLTGCVKLTAFPLHGSISFGRLRVRGCSRLQALPDWLTHLAELDISNCPRLTSLPASLRVASTLELGDTALPSLPPTLRNAQLRWHSVAVTERIVFQPETITAQEALSEQNAELRRVLIERMGYENFFEQAVPHKLDQDEDAGGKRQLLRIDLTNDEPMVMLAVQCPSTARRYLIRVPPAMRTCHQSAAWIAGFDDPEQYRPIAET